MQILPLLLLVWRWSVAVSVLLFFFDLCLYQCCSFSSLFFTHFLISSQILLRVESVVTFMHHRGEVLPNRTLVSLVDALGLIHQLKHCFFRAGLV